MAPVIMVNSDVYGSLTGDELDAILDKYRYPVAVKHLGIAIDQAKERGLLGKDIFGTGFNFSVAKPA